MWNRYNTWVNQDKIILGKSLDIIYQTVYSIDSKRLTKPLTKLKEKE